MITIRSWLVQLALWVIARYAPPPAVVSEIVLTVAKDALFFAAQALAKEQQEQYPERSGESKRHQVFAALLKAHPNATKRAVALAIEAALGD